MALYTALPQAQAQTAAATESAHQYAIPAGPLSAALSAWGVQSDRQLVFVPDLAAGKQSRGVSGYYSDEGALAKLLDGTRLTSERVNAETYTLKPDPSAATKGPAVQNRDPGAASQAIPASQANQLGQPDQATQLKAVVVTGSRIRRVDVETANPVVTITPETIQQTGKPTLGDIVQDLPAVTGFSINPNINNGGGEGGETLIGLRGLGSNRTLVLVDGQRVINKDMNAIPASLVERIEVLTNGASSVYGSDAIGGVINIILKPDYQGAQVQLNSGVSSHGDGQQKGASFMFGQTSDRGSIMAGVDYNQTDAIPESARSFSKHTLSITGSTDTPLHVFFGGSGSPPRGNIVLPSSLRAQFGCRTVSLNPSSLGGSSPKTLADFHCFDSQTDRFSFAPYRTITIPQERTNGFFKGIYHVTDNIDASFTWIHNKTSSGFGLGPNLWGTGVGGVLSKDSMYNPFGIDFSQATGNTFRSRLPPAGNRFTAIQTTTDQAMFGVRGKFSLWNQDWTWDIGYDYGHVSEVDQVRGLASVDLLNPGLGPSMLVGGVPSCVSTPGDPSTVIAGCIPWDTFNLDNPASQKVLSDVTLPAEDSARSIERIKHVDITGGLFDLPAGTVQLAAGLSWRTEYTNSAVDPALLVNADGTCTLGSQCSAPLQGGFNVKEAYAELFVPVLKDLPLVHSLNLDFGDRYSKFSDFGSTSNWKIGVEYRPISDLLLRGTVAEVFRAPTISDIFSSPSQFNQAIQSDPCDHATVANAACVGVPLDGTFVNQQVADHQLTIVQGSGSKYADFPLKPESGKSFDFGAVYSPSYLPGLSVSVDTWRIYLNDVITSIGGQTVLNGCYTGISQFCPLIQRFGANTGNPGQFIRLLLPTANLGRVDVKGTDMQASYRLPELPFGRFVASLSVSYLTRYDLQTAPGQAGNQIYHQAGNINVDVGGGLAEYMPRFRGMGSLSWKLGDLNATWRLRYLGAFALGSHDPSRDYSAVPGFSADNPYVMHFGAHIYSDVSAGYKLTVLDNVTKPFKSRIDVGVNNLFDKQPPILYENNLGLGNANTDPADFDPIGRYYWARLTVNF